MEIQFLETDVMRIVKLKRISNVLEEINMDLMNALKFVEMGSIMESMNAMIGILKTGMVVTQHALLRLVGIA